MNAIPAGFTRSTTLLSAQQLLNGLGRTNIDLLRVQNQLTTGRLINRTSDDALRSATVNALDMSLERSEQRLRNLSQASTTLAVLDSSLGEADASLIEARNIALDQIGVGSNPEARRPLGQVIHEKIRQLVQIANTETNGLYVFGGASATTRPIQEVLGGFQYVGHGAGMNADLGLSGDVNVTIGGDNAIGETSARLRSVIDLDPELTADTLLRDLNGAGGTGIQPGVVAFSLDGGEDVEVDLTQAESVQDVIDLVNASIEQYQLDNGLLSLPPGSFGIDGSNFAVSMFGAPPNTSLEFKDLGLGTTASDLGLTVGVFDPSSEDGVDVDPRLTTETSLSAIPSLTLPLGEIRISFSRPQIDDPDHEFIVDLAGAETIDEIRNRIETVVPGTRVVVNEDGTAIDIFNEISGPAMSVEEVAGGVNTAEQLGIRSYTGSTLLSDFNFGRGVSALSGRTDPVSGAVEYDLNVDFWVTIPSGQEFPVDLQPEDLESVDTVIAKINSEYNRAVLDPDITIDPGSFLASLSDDRNGIMFTDPLGVATGAISVRADNNSSAANDLGLLDPDPTSANFVAQDRAGVRVESLFTRLMDLRDALYADDEVGINLAGEALQDDLDRVTSARALVGVSTRRIEDGMARQEDLQVFDTQLRSNFQDLDFAEASVRFNLLQTQLSAIISSGATTLQNTLIGFLG